ncbi:hypothetical protein AWM79_01175 [Pseudomonas agarici]|uniref:Uncharacterized protein n=1 Tax=Pseudomonas agarici TaxID=46677 RepID=A0A0X1SVP9_PSEAA|nr:hypothetical protein [Pseudomonas agarici]AMB83993.1 hypothetical protein AWM79_01175 [Pseudomonas agarici]NWB91478.1 hypothetical protein [Pseudomonas agarici]NWC07774.1 hypothetical protein [Pseudomonas agarici]SEK74040.1 hypothetical protein SAMN05216604_10642 [Pseudomonas agarici]
MGNNNSDDKSQTSYTLTHAHVELLKKRLDELKGKELKADDDIFSGVGGGDDVTSWRVAGYYNKN